LEAAPLLSGALGRGRLPLAVKLKAVSAAARAARRTSLDAYAVASDLTIRIRAKDHIEPTFLTAYLSSLYLTGYWRERAGGASGSMKKITRSQIQKEQVPLPPLLDQRRIASQLAAQMASAWRLRRTLTDQLDMVNKLPAALLRRAFDGGYDDGRTDEQRKR
jgi:hypothetical protein